MPWRVSRAVKAAHPRLHGGLGWLASVAVCRRVPGGPGDRCRGRRPGRRHVREIVERLANESVAGCPGTLVRRREIISGPPRRCVTSTSCRAHDYSLHPRRALFRAQGQAPDRLHLVAGVPLSLRVLRRSRGLRARVDRPRSRTHRRRGRRRSSPLHAFDELAFQDETFFTHPGADRSPGRRVPHASTLRSPGQRRCGPIRPAAWASALFAEVCARRSARVMVGVESGSQADARSAKKDMRLDQVMAAAEMCARS